MPVIHRDDFELTSRDIQDISSRDALASLFAKLGFETSSRLVQEPEHLGISAETTCRPLRHVERLASNDGLFEVYLFEVSSVTVAHTRALVRAFRNLDALNALLVLTSDYERLDFVLVERSAPKMAAGGFGVRQVEVRSRALTVDRRNPGPVNLRVLRRFTWTEADAFAQFDKIRAAYAVAEWSEEQFNNRALFSDHFLLRRMPEFPEWREDVKPALRVFRGLLQGAAAKLAGENESAARALLLEPALRHLGFSTVLGKAAGDASPAPDFLLRASPGGEPVAFCLAYRWNRQLDGKDPLDPESPEENPAVLAVSLLEQAVADWGIVTNGRLWRLYSQKTSAKATSYLEIDLEEAVSGPDPDSFRYFWLLFRSAAFERRSEVVDGAEVERCLLDALLTGSEAFAKELGERLKERVFEEVFPHLATGLIESIRAAEGKAADLSEDRLSAVYQATLVLLYRLLFVLFAESRDLLPHRDVRGYFEVSLEKLRREIAAAGGTIDDEAPRYLTDAYDTKSSALAERIARLFRVIDGGDASLNVPAYNGGLFHTPQDGEEAGPEGEASRFLSRFPIADRYLAQAIDRLARSLDEKSHDLKPVDFKSLGVRHLGSIYEGLLEFRVRIASERLAIRKEKGQEVYAPWHGLSAAEQARAEKQGRFVDRGQVYLENDKHERKASGSYYTPDPIVKYIVEQAVGPILTQKLDALRPAFREAQQWREKQRKLAKTKGEDAEKYETGPAVIERWRAAVLDPMFDLKVLDPAMGSGHFLVEAVDFVSDKLIEFLAAFPWNPVTAFLDSTRRDILRSASEQGIDVPPERLTDVNLLKRHVLKRCLYGVDLNPMAVELAKLSLWLHCFTLGAPLSFLDHHLRCGNSLIGVTVEETREAVEAQATVFGTRFAGLLLATDLMRQVGELSDVTPQQVLDSRRQYGAADAALAPFRRVLDVFASRWFGNGEPPKRRGKKRGEAAEPIAIQFLRSGESKGFLEAASESEVRECLGRLPKGARAVAQQVLLAARRERFFHWELEFPEVFFGGQSGSAAAASEDPGFDAVIGNPPYDVLASEELGRDVSEVQEFVRAASVYSPAVRGKQNLYKLFICRSFRLVNRSGSLAFIVPMALLGDEQSAGVRRALLLDGALRIVEVFPQKDNPRLRVFEEAKLSTCVVVVDRRPTGGSFRVRTHPAKDIAATSKVLTLASDDLEFFDSENLPIPSCTQEDWELAIRILKRPDVHRLGDSCRAFQGEVNETTDGKSGLLSHDSTAGPRVLRGSNISLYAIRPASQGEDFFLRKALFLSSKPDSEKAVHHKEARVGWQESSPQNNFRRIIAAPISAGEFCNHKINYVPKSGTEIELGALLAFLNSAVHDWFFRLTSANAAVSHYQIYLLPLPKEIPSGLEALCASIQEVERTRLLASRHERSFLSDDSLELQGKIDEVVAYSLGLSTEDLGFVIHRLTEML